MKKNERSILEELIRRNGFCGFTYCDKCPLGERTEACSTNESAYELAVVCYLEKYSREDLVEILI